MNTLNTFFLSSTEVFGIEVFDNDFYKLLVLFGLNFLSTIILARFIYYPYNNKKREFIFAYMVVSSVIFFLCFALKAFKFNTGVAIGLFALLGVIRFRTDTISLKEMAYLFVFIGVSMINAFSKKMSLYEIGFINLAFISITAIGEMLLQQKTVVKRTANFELTYANLTNLNPENYPALKADISSKTGLNVQSVKITSIDLKTNEAKLKVYFEK
ncbi:MAG: DUF4956 domain-containing protein [Flavobacteriales bacterium]|jgi:membrane protease subunit (stomatin/prohibitin family)